MPDPPVDFFSTAEGAIMRSGHPLANLWFVELTGFWLTFGEEGR